MAMTGKMKASKAKKKVARRKALVKARKIQANLPPPRYICLREDQGPTVMGVTAAGREAKWLRESKVKNWAILDRKTGAEFDSQRDQRPELAEKEDKPTMEPSDKMPVSD